MVEGSVALGCLAAETNLVKASVEHVVGKLGIVVHSVVVCLDAVGVVDSEFGVVAGLDGLVDDTVYYTQRVELHGVTRHATIRNLEVLIIEVVEERRSVVASV